MAIYEMGLFLYVGVFSTVRVAALMQAVGAARMRFRWHHFKPYKVQIATTLDLWAICVLCTTELMRTNRALYIMNRQMAAA